MTDKITKELNKFVDSVCQNRYKIEYLYFKLSSIPSFMLHNRGKYKYIYWYYVYKLMLITKI
jgi:hypothetical protein|nr:MAG TPA: hypothetical protein [Caudoviricetes sp.]